METVQNVTALPMKSITAAELVELTSPSSAAQVIAQAEADVAADVESYTIAAFDQSHIAPRAWRRLVSARAKFLQMLNDGRPNADIALADYKLALESIVELLYVLGEEDPEPPATMKPRKGKGSKH
jgi:hypothetical protein